MTTLAEALDRQPERLRFADDGRIPNSRLPALLYRRRGPAHGMDAVAFERLFAAHGWRGAWCDGIYPFHHFHSTSHEVLGIAGGSARVALGGPAGRQLQVGTGDVLVIPAGVGHRLERADAGFLVVGAYPDGRGWDLCRGEPAERTRVLRNLAAVPLPASDPVHGATGPLLSAWADADRV